MEKHSKWMSFILAAAVLCPLFIYMAVYGVMHGDVEGDSSLTRLPFGGSTLAMVGSPLAMVGSPLPATVPAPQPTLICKHYIGKDFMSSVSAVESEIVQTDENSTPAQELASEGSSGYSDNAGRISGGIVPHHLLAGKMIASFFKTLSESNPQTLIILAPNHRRIGHTGLNTSLLDWSTPFGILKNDPVLTNQLISSINASQNNTLMEEEHSISSLAPYIKYYMPDVKIVPILLHGNYSADASSKLGSLLSKKLTDATGTAIIASVDFSHYLDADMSDRMDEKTLSAIKAFDTKEISLMGNDNLDSPPSVIALLYAMKEVGAVVPEVTGHDNSSDIAGKGFDYTTSYFTILFRR